MTKCSWPGCPREQNAPYCFLHSRGNTVKSNSKPQQPLSIPELTDKAQKCFNAYIRQRDKNLGCITCGGQVTDAGHYIPVGTNSTLRFEETNVHGQCAKENRLEYGNMKAFRTCLIKKIGIKKVEALENTPSFHKWSRQELQNIIENYTVLSKDFAEKVAAPPHSLNLPYLHKTIPAKRSAEG